MSFFDRHHCTLDCCILFWFHWSCCSSVNNKWRYKSLSFSLSVSLSLSLSLSPSYIAQTNHWSSCLYNELVCLFCNRTEVSLCTILRSRLAVLCLDLSSTVCGTWVSILQDETLHFLLYFLSLPLNAISLNATMILDDNAMLWTVI